MQYLIANKPIPVTNIVLYCLIAVFASILSLKIAKHIQLPHSLMRI